jgi:thioredoxin-like negative regulator of GroEL
MCKLPLCRRLPGNLENHRMPPFFRILGALIVGASLAGGVSAATASILEYEASQAVETPAATVDTAAVSVAAYRAGFFALAGRAGTAREILDALSLSDRERAVELIFATVHPIADSGDEKSAGPIMELVVHYAPTHFMALYHAGMAAHVAGDDDRARIHLANFLEYYHANDSWRANAIEVLKTP